MRDVSSREYVENINSDNIICINRVWLDLMGSLTGAVFLDQLVFWCKESIRKHNKEGWVYKTQGDWGHFYLSRREVEQARRKLREMGALEESRMGLPAKLHYRINYDALVDALGKEANRDCQMLQTSCNMWQSRSGDVTQYTDTNNQILPTDTIHQENPSEYLSLNSSSSIQNLNPKYSPSLREDASDGELFSQSEKAKTGEIKRGSKTASKGESVGFAAFWELYPRKDGKMAARKAWDKQGCEAELSDILEALPKHPALNERERQFIPMPASFLNGRRWEDEIGTVAPSGLTPAQEALEAWRAEQAKLKEES